MTWHYPSTITSATSIYTAWTTTGQLIEGDFDQLKTVQPLSSISVNLSGSTSSKDANPPAVVEIRDEIRYQRTAPLILTGFGLNVSGTITGIEVDIVAQRNNRISDWDIRLVYQGDKIGSNQKQKIERNDRDQPGYTPNTVRYGSSTSTWGADVTDSVVNSAQFGISIEMTSHPITPHRDTAYIDGVRMRIFT